MGLGLGVTDKVGKSKSLQLYTDGFNLLMAYVGNNKNTELDQPRPLRETVLLQ